MTLAPTVLQDIARMAAERWGVWMRDDIEGDVVLALVEADPSDEQEAVGIARLAADASRKRQSRSSGARGIAMDGARIGLSDADPTPDAAAQRILLDAAVCAARAGMDFSSSRVLGRLLRND